MMERHDHNNPWADKLQAIPLPEENVSWDAMEAVLDREMPVNKRGDRRRWVLLIILLLLLIGVCNCPGRRLTGDRANRPEVTGKVDTMQVVDAVAKESAVRKETRRTVDHPRRVEDADSTGGSATGGDAGAKRRSTPGADLALKGRPARMADPVSKRGSTPGGDLALKGRPARMADPVSKRGSTPGGDLALKGRDGRSGGEGTKVGRREKGDPRLVGDTTRVDSVLADRPGLLGGRGPMGHPRTVGGPGGHSDSAAMMEKKAGADKKAAADKKPAPDKKPGAERKPKADSILQMKGWLAGIGLNQFFTLGRQQQSNYNSSGTTGGLSDYVPVPMVRYYFSRKLYVQLEAQFNTPQYTTKNLLASLSKPDSLTIPGQVLQTSLYIKKLFYFNLPLSIHYSPVPNLYIGGGIQYARLTNGVALYQDSGHSIFLGGADSLKSSTIKSFRNDPVYRKLKTNEFRLLLDLNYNFKRFVIGGRYNRALSDFINLQISNNQVTQSRNSSFQVYLRYIIWDGRKKILLPK